MSEDLTRRATRYVEEAGVDRMMRPGVKDASFVNREAIKSSAGILLRAGREVAGVMFVNYRGVSDVFSADERYVMETLASQAALAIQGARHVRDVITARNEALRQSRPR